MKRLALTVLALTATAAANAATVSLAEANRPRAEFIAGLIVDRVPREHAGQWAGYTSQERLACELIEAAHVVCTRPGHPGTRLSLSEIQMTDIKSVDWGKPKVISSKAPEQVRSTIHLEKPISYHETISHTFSKTRTLLESAKVGAEASIRGLVGGEFAGVKAEVEVTAKITSEYQRQWGEASTQSDTVSREITVQGPINLEYEAKRSVDRVQRKVTPKADFSYRIVFTDDNGPRIRNLPHLFFVWNSWEEFQLVAQGLAPRDRPTPRELAHTRWEKDITHLYYEFLDRPLTKREVKSLKRPSAAKVSFLAEYDNVVSQEINVL